MQCIIATPYLNDYFINEYKHESQHRKQRLSEAYYELIQKAKKKLEATIAPIELKNAVSKIAP